MEDLQAAQLPILCKQSHFKSLEVLQQCAITINQSSMLIRTSPAFLMILHYLQFHGECLYLIAQFYDILFELLEVTTTGKH